MADSCDKLQQTGGPLLAQFPSALDDAVRDIAEDAGVLDDYTNAVGEYRKAMKLNHAWEATKELGQKALEAAIGFGLGGCLCHRPQIYAMNAKCKGSRNEHRSILLLESAGYACTRAAASLGVFDIVGVGLTDVVLVQCKTPTGQAQSRWKLSAIFSARRCARRPFIDGHRERDSPIFARYER